MVQQPCSTAATEALKKPLWVQLCPTAACWGSFVVQRRKLYALRYFAVHLFGDLRGLVLSWDPMVVSTSWSQLGRRAEPLRLEKRSGPCYLRRMGVTLARRFHQFLGQIRSFVIGRVGAPLDPIREFGVPCFRNSICALDSSFRYIRLSSFYLFLVSACARLVSEQ